MSIYILTYLSLAFHLPSFRIICYSYLNLLLNKMRTLNLVICIAIALLVSIRPHAATRILHEVEEEWMKKQHLILPSLPRVVNPPAPNSCSNVPGNGGRPCSSSATISERNFAGQGLAVAPPPPPPNAYPQQMVQFGVATNLK